MNLNTQNMKTFLLACLSLNYIKNIPFAYYQKQNLGELQNNLSFYLHRELSSTKKTKWFDVYNNTSLYEKISLQFEQSTIVTTRKYAS